jgi:AcrR family transcriptional regulator
MSGNVQQKPRTRKPRGQGASRRGEILAAASRIFLEEGVEHATMRRIAASVGVCTTALYVYFSDKDAILQAIAEATFAELLETLEASQRGDVSPPDRFRAGLRAYVQFGLSRPDAYRLTFLSPGSRPPAKRSDSARPMQAADRSFEILQRGVEEMMAAGLFRPGPSEPLAEAIWACLHGVTALLLDQATHLNTPAERLIEQVLDIVMSGCGGPIEIKQK